MRRLSKLYETYNFITMKSEGFKAASKEEKWRKAMK